VTADDASALAHLDAQARAARLTVTVFLDLDCGQHRTGTPPGPHAFELYRQILAAQNLAPGGLHIYDGHLQDSDPDLRLQAWRHALEPCWHFHGQLRQAGLPVPTVVAGGTPTFPFHAQAANVECSPGTCVFWDAGYHTKFKDLDFHPATLVFTRVISKPGPHLLCLDLGHKAIASENPHPRVIFPDLPEARALSHSEEHLVLESPEARRFQVGQGLCGIPWHICPTVALYGEAIPIHNHVSTSPWKISARERRWHF
jgi:D-serine deaminase-like pyridoxal phosphate-dependent protein